MANKDAVIARERELQRLNDADITTLANVLNTDRHLLPAKFAFGVSSADLTETPDAKMQRNESMAGLYSQWAQTIMPLAQQILSPQSLQMKAQAPALYMHMLTTYVGSTKFLQQVFNESGIDDADKYLPDVTIFEQMLEQMKIQMAAAMGGSPGGNLAQQPGPGTAGPGNQPPGTGGGPAGVPGAVPGNAGPNGGAPVAVPAGPSGPGTSGPGFPAGAQ